MNPTVNPSLKLSTLGKELVVLVPSTEQTHTLAPVAAAVLSASDGSRGVPALLVVAKGVDESVTESQIWGLLDRFASAGLLETTAAPAAAPTPAVGRRGWIQSVVGGTAAVAATVLVAGPASAKKNEAAKACKAKEGKKLGKGLDKLLEYERQATFKTERNAKGNGAQKRQALIQKIKAPSERRRKMGQEQLRKRRHLQLDAGDGTAAWLAFDSGPVLEVTLAAGTGSLLPTDSTPVPLTLEVRTVFSEEAADDIAARAELAVSEADLSKQIAAGEGKENPALIAAEQKIKKALAEPGLSATAHAADMKLIGELIADSGKSAQTVTLALGAQALVVGDLEVLGGETENIGVDSSGRSTADRVRLLVRLPAGAEAMLVSQKEVVECVDTLGIAGEVSWLDDPSDTPNANWTMAVAGFSG